MPSLPHSGGLHIMMAASEAMPYAKTGGLADVLGALPQELAKLGHQVTLVLPCYPTLIARRQSLQPMAKLRIPTAEGIADVVLEKETTSVPGSIHPLTVIAVRYDPFFDRPGLYGSADGDYPDNLDRFILFCRAVLETIKLLAATQRAAVNILHLHDWQAALCAVYLKAGIQDVPALNLVKTILTLHNVGYQGIFPGEQFSKIGLPPALFAPTGLEFYGSANLLKGGIIFADTVSTVSRTYAKEILAPEFGAGLEGVLAGRADGIHGITNGIDVTVWNPATDAHLPANYSSDDLANKKVCKRALQQQLELPRVNVPLLAVIGRLTPQKGFDLFLSLLPELMALDVQVAVLGAGDTALEEQYSSMKARYPDRIGLYLGYNEGLAHRIEAGADMLVMPSRYEPCGLTQLYSLRYGTIPIVRRTGGLADTVVPYKPSTMKSKQATGFHFIEASADAALSAIVLALAVYKDKKSWNDMILAGMRSDLSWTQVAERYEQLYRLTVGEKGSATIRS